MKIFYEKYDDTVQSQGEDKIPGWQPSREDIVAEIVGEKLSLTTKYESGLVDIKIMSIIDNSNGRIVAQHLDQHLGITVFVQNVEANDEATLTLINHDYIVGRYLRRVNASSQIISGPNNF